MSSATFIIVLPLKLDIVHVRFLETIMWGPFYDILQSWTERRYASIQDAWILIQPYYIDRWDVSDSVIFVSTGFPGSQTQWNATVHAKYNI